MESSKNTIQFICIIFFARAAFLDAQINNVRLVGGNSSAEGRVEVFYNGEWGTVCDDNFDDKDAAVVCSMLGYSSMNAKSKQQAFFGQGTGRIWIDELKCTDYDTSIFNCSQNILGSHDCGHREDAGVVCNMFAAPNIRLVGGHDTLEGRLEIFHNNEWGTVCDDSWNSKDASVVCFMLGYSRENAISTGTARFGQGQGPIWMDDVSCQGTENDIFDCNKTLVNHNCDHSDDAGVICSKTHINKVRLVGGNSSAQGRVEVFIKGEWGTVCDDSFDDKDAAVVCLMLGYSSMNAKSKQQAFFGQGTGRIWIDELKCTDYDTSIFNCSQNILGSHDCGHREDAGVVCNMFAAPNIRLVGGDTLEGRLEIFHNNEWGTVCDDSWDSKDASVVCFMLGYSRENAISTGTARFGQGQGPIWMDDVSCQGTENDIFDCNKTLVNHNCDHSDDAGVICSKPPINKVRLVGGNSSAQGRVEVFINGEWGTVCDDSFDDKDAAVVCLMLGYSSMNAKSKQQAFFGQGTGRIWIDELKCTDYDTSIFNCSQNILGSHDCVHREDVGVVCNMFAAPNIRLVGGNDSLEGRLEIFHNNEWGTVCNDSWDSKDASVVCFMLGYSRENATSTDTARFGQGQGPIWMDDVSCQGTENDIFDCNKTLVNHYCDHSDDAGVICSKTPINKVRLVGGNSSAQGRVEVFIKGEWGTVCDDSFDDKDAAVICSMLGYSSMNAKSKQQAFFGQGTGRIWIDELKCTDYDTNIFNCSQNIVGSHNCGHYEDAGVECNMFAAPNIRLVGGNDSLEGRLEILYNNEWGTVCNDSWDSKDASVVCFMLGYSRENATSTDTARFGQGQGPIWMDDVSCQGTENDIFDCNKTLVNHYCDHSGDAGVICSKTPINKVRLVGGNSSAQGRVEVFIKGEWGTVCDDSFDDKDAAVICSMLGYSSMNAKSKQQAFFGQGTCRIWIDELKCTDYDTNIFNCSQNIVGSHNCGHYEDAGVECNMFAAPNIRLVGGTDSQEGRLEILYNNEWGTVCNDSWDSKDASVVCFMLGYSRENAISTGTARFGRGQGPIWMDDVSCQGIENDIFDCNKTLVNHNCDHSDDAGVVCSKTQMINVRLVGGNSSAEGRVEVFYNEEWGTVCDDNFDDKDAAVVCSMLGYSSMNAKSKQQAFFGQGHGRIWMDQLECTDYDTNILTCSRNAMGIHDCSHGEDAGVVCNMFAAPNIRLVGGNDSLEGRLEIFHNNEWGTVCDDSWDSKDASVVCFMLGYSRKNAISTGTVRFGQGQGPIWMDDVSCQGTENDIFDCNKTLVNHNCDHSDDAGVICSKTSINKVRLVGGNSSAQGRVEVFIKGEWGTVCDDSFDDKDAAVVCLMLGYSSMNAKSKQQAFFGQGTGRIWIDELGCTDYDTNIFNCSQNIVGSHNCGHYEDAGVECNMFAAPNIRLVGGTDSQEGRLEIFHNNEWGTVCDDSWDSKDASVVCFMLGYSRENATSTDTARFGQGQGPIWMDDVSCQGTENDIFDCNKTLVNHNCDHSEDAGVICSTPINKVRLVGGNSSAQGRVEVFIKGEWGTVCDDSFDDKDAAVICSMLGLPSMNATAKGQAFFGQGNGRIWMDNLRCTDNDTDLFTCPQNALGSHNCRHNEDAGVLCHSYFTDCGNADILIIMDESGSVGSDHFNTMKTFVGDVVRGLNSVFFRFSVITYSTSARKIFGFLDFNNINAIMTSIEHIQYAAGGSTETDRALEYARVSIFNTKRADAADIVILFTDGKSDNSEKTKEEAVLLRNEGVRIFSIGVGSGPKIEELQSIASSPSDEHVFQVSSFSALSHILNAVQTRTCQASVDGGFSEWTMWTKCSRTCGHGLKSRRRTCTNPVPTRNGRNCTGTYSENTECSIAGCPVHDCGNADILIIMDESGSVGSDHFNTMKTFVGDVVRGLNSVFFRFSVITYSTSARKIFGFLDFNNINAIMTSIEHIQYAAGGSTETDRALEYARVSIFNTKRADAADIVILFTDGKSDNSEKTKEEAALLRNEGVRIFSIGVGSGPKIEELQSIASSPSDEHVFQVSSFSALSHILNAVQTRTCQASVDGGFSEWTKWTKCSRTCGHGLKSRRRTCTNPVPTRNGRNCTGTYSENTECSIAGCPVDGNWGHWSSWLDCSVTCGTGNQIRRRFCSNPRPENGGRQCQGSSTDTLTCNLGSCPIHGGFSEWNMWSVCSVSCGGGFKTRERACTNPSPRHGGSNCSDNFTDSDICNTSPCPVNGGFGNWGSWSMCSKRCEGGYKVRRRLCNSPTPKYGGKNCIGNASQNLTCNELPCPINGGFTEWSNWTDCSKSCGGGLNIRNRSCTNPSPKYGGKHCEGSLSEFLNCNEHQCPIDGGFSLWGAWSSCTVSCGSGTSIRSRSCTNPSPLFGGKNCTGNSEQIIDCNIQLCPIDGKYGDWTTWSQCSNSCGGGSKLRLRRCDNPLPQNGGKQCNGINEDHLQCNTQPCPVDGHFNEWGTWTLCSHSCGGGIKTRFRLCNDPFPAFGGRNCSGSFQQFSQCNPLPCPIDGGLSIWNEWSLCSSTCGGGIQIRNRSCTNPVPQNGGKECEGETADSLDCNAHECPIDGNFSDWGAWTMCSVTCGGGARVRSRTCTNPSPHFGGKECSGESGQSENCNNISCPVDGGYSEWSSWTECTVTCGGGTSMRRRTCTNPSPQHGGKQCEGEANVTVECNTNSCSICNNPAMEFECHNKVHCIDKDYVCDGLPDCADNSDEIPAVCGGQADRTCPEGLYRCPDGSCKTGPEC
ncbi:uncharacterized protein [Magallana gigas]|uniref:uncharacterized protein isoform X2 n=1 Tax=Magallana gigas TaxID=29159 RepID=UPI00333FD569